MSWLSKILDKFGRREEQPTIIGTTKVVQPDPPNADSDVKSAHATLPTNAAPDSDIDVKNDKHFQKKQKSN